MNHHSAQVPSTLRGQRTRQKLVDAAEFVFGEKGFERASISDITREAGVALGTFYVYFPDKRALLVEVVDGLGAKLRTEIAEAVKDLEDRLAIEREGFRAFFEFTARHRLLYRVVRQTEFVDEDCFRRYYTGVATPYARALALAQERGQLRRIDPEALAYALMGIADFLGMRYVLWGRGEQMETALDAALELLRHGLDAPASPDRQRPEVEGPKKPEALKKPEAPKRLDRHDPARAELPVVARAAGATAEPAPGKTAARGGAKRKGR
jgi:AcrR family transcriptional regulator